MGFLVAAVLVAAFAVAVFLLRRRARSAAPPGEVPKTLPFPPWEPLGLNDSVAPLEKSVAGQNGFLLDLQRREHEATAGPRPRDVARREAVIEVEFREVADRDAS